MPSGTRIPHYIFVASSDPSPQELASVLTAWVDAWLHSFYEHFFERKGTVAAVEKPLKTAINRSDCRTFRPQTHSKIQLVVHAPAIWQVQGYAAICSFQWVLCKGPP